MKVQAVWLMVLGVAFLAPSGGLAMDEDDAPESVEIESLSNLYTAVQFDHAAHLDMAECADCHHHTTGSVPTEPTCARCHEGGEESDSVSCSSCHAARPFIHESLVTLENPEIFHVDKPGLKGAFHLKCLGCHDEAGGPTGCQDCHQMTELGEKRFNSGKYAPSGYSAEHNVKSAPHAGEVQHD